METAVEIDEDKIDEAALALFYLTLHDKFGRAWKQIDWSITDRLYEKGYIHDPVGKSKSVVLTEEGLAKSEELFKKLFVPTGRRKRVTTGECFASNSVTMSRAL